MDEAAFGRAPQSAQAGMTMEECKCISCAAIHHKVAKCRHQHTTRRQNKYASIPHTQTYILRCPSDQEVDLWQNLITQTLII